MLGFYFESSEDNAGAVMSALGPIITLVKDFRVEVMHEAVKAKRKCVKRGSKTEEAVLSVLEDRQPHTKDAMCDALEAAGMSRNSITPTLTKLVREGRCARINGGGAILIGTP